MQPPFFFCASLSFLCCFSKSKKRRKQIPIQLSPIIILSCCVRNETTRKMKIDEVESTTKKARVATHTHIKVLFFYQHFFFFFLSLSLSLSSCNQCAKPKLLRVDDAVNRHRGRFLFLSLSLTRLIFSFSARRNECLRETHDRVSG